MIYPVWRQQLVRSLHIHRSKPESKYFQVASVTSETLPKLRTMVFRGFQEDSNRLVAVTDIRSEKVADWQTHPNAELHWYFVKSREQYRLSCRVAVIYQNQSGDLDCFGELEIQSDDMKNLYQEHWEKLSKGAQDGFFCPAPKSMLNKTTQVLSPSTVSSEVTARATVEEAKHASNKKAGISQHFSVVVFVPTSVDYLGLKTTPHTRTLYTCDGESWSHQSVNP